MDHDAGLDRFLPWRKVHDITGLGRTTAWRLRRAGDFPHPVPISPGRVAWRERDIAAWNESRGQVPMRLATPRPSTKTDKPSPSDASVLPSAGAPPETLDAGRPIEPPPSIRPRRRVGKGIAEGQLGFEF